MNNAPMVKLAGLFRRTSKNGNEYFSGLLGGARVLIFENREHDPEDPKSPSHHLFIQERDEKPAEATRLPSTNQTPPPVTARAGRDFRHDLGTGDAEPWLFDAAGRRRRNPNCRPSSTSVSAKDVPF
jgi:hypothetical protein